MAQPEKTPAIKNLRDDIAAIKRERILKEAAELFYERGYTNTSVDAIAERLGVTKPFIYYQFESKIDLLVEICERGTREALAVTRESVSEPLPPVDRLALFVRRFTAVVLQTRKYVAIYFREQINLPEKEARSINQMRKQIDSLLQKLLREGADAGDFTFDDLGMCSLVITGMSSYAFAWYRERNRLSQDEICEQMVRMVMRVVGVEHAG